MSSVDFKEMLCEVRAAHGLAPRDFKKFTTFQKRSFYQISVIEM